MSMRPIKLAFRFAIAAGMVLVLAAPVAGATRQDGLVPNAARQAVFHSSQASGVAIGSLRIPAIGLDETVRSGIALSVIDRGVAHWSGTARPGESGNVVLAGHRATKTKPFRDLDKLNLGDLVFMTNGRGFEVIYRVSDTYIVDPNDLWITYDGPTPSVTMFACHPKGSARYRIVVNADLVAGRRIA
ncbi:MAG: class E sortase [Acidimicrobiia bacterium]